MHSMMLAFTSFLQERSPSVISIVIISGTYLLYTVLRVSTTAYRRSAFSRANGCKPIPSYPHKGPVFGPDVFFEGAKPFNAGKYCSPLQEPYGLVNNGVNTFHKSLALTGRSEKRIQDELWNILLAGRDTTAGLLSHLFHTLARRPDIFQKLRAEVLRLGDRKPSCAQIKEMKCL